MTDMYATSTIAMSIYNWIARHSAGVEDLAIVRDALLAEQHTELSDKLFDRAAAELADRKLLVKRGGRFDVCDRRRRVVIARDRSDFQTDKATGEIRGGWEGWTTKDPRMGLARLDEVMR